jgi:hypothetical protein
MMQWRTSSGITKVEDNGDKYTFTNNSGSVYECKKENEGLSLEYSTWFDDGKATIVDVSEIVLP